MSLINKYEEEVLKIKPELTQEDVDDFLDWLKDNGDESESLTSAVNRYFGAMGECGL